MRELKVYKKGFSLVEMIVVIAVMALVLPAIFGIVFSILKQEVTAYELTEVKRQGDGALSTIQNALRPVIKVYLSDNSEVCDPDETVYPATYSTSSGQDVFFLDNNNNRFQVYTDQNQLKYGLSPNGSSLTTSKVQIISFQMKCDREASYAPAILTLNYTIKYNTSQIPNNPLTYRTRIVLRNY